MAQIMNFLLPNSELNGVAAPCPWVLVRVGRGGPGAPHAGTESPGGWGLGLPEGSTA